jgi:uncharacterized protein YjiS (DUF1127 family)
MEKLGTFPDRLQFGAPRPRRASILSWLGAALERRRQRDLLATLDDRALSDIGIGREAAREEADKPFWR